MKYIYLHGFASSPGSQKAQRFKREFEKRGKELLVPDLDGGDFRNLTISRQMDLIGNLIAEHSSHQFSLIGSSMGGYLGLLAGQINPKITALYLMCPGLNFLNRWLKKLKMDASDQDAIPHLIRVFHYRYNRDEFLDTFLFEDAKKWEQISLDRVVPTRIVHGKFDETVDIRESRDFVKNRSWCELVELESDHSLLSHLDWIVGDCLSFFNFNGVNA